MKYLMLTWDDRTKSTAKDVFNVRWELIKDLEKLAPVSGAAEASGKKQEEKSSGDKCPKNPYLYH